MKLIAHRGNTNGCFESYENEPNYIDLAIKMGYDVEIDVWFENDRFYLGHDGPQYGIDINFLLDRKENLWVHVKNFSALNELLDSDIRIFYHEKENHTIIYNTKLIWSHNLCESGEKSIIPLLSKEDSEKYLDHLHVYGICSDFVENIKNKYEV